MRAWSLALDGVTTSHLCATAAALAASSPANYLQDRGTDPPVTGGRHTRVPRWRLLSTVGYRSSTTAFRLQRHPNAVCATYTQSTHWQKLHSRWSPIVDRTTSWSAMTKPDISCF